MLKITSRSFVMYRCEFVIPVINCAMKNSAIVERGEKCISTICKRTRPIFLPSFTRSRITSAHQLYHGPSSPDNEWGMRCSFMIRGVDETRGRGQGIGSLRHHGIRHSCWGAPNCYGPRIHTPGINN